MSDDTDKGFPAAIREMTPRQFAEYIREQLARWESIEDTAGSIATETMAAPRLWIVRWWQAREARSLRNEATRTLHVLRHAQHFLAPDLVAQVFANDGFHVGEVDGELMVDRFVVSPLPALALVSVVDNLYARRAFGGHA